MKKIIKGVRIKGELAEWVEENLSEDFSHHCREALRIYRDILTGRAVYKRINNIENAGNNKNIKNDDFNEIIKIDLKEKRNIKNFDSLAEALDNDTI